jgi:hypothetical protein
LKSETSFVHAPSAVHVCPLIGVGETVVSSVTVKAVSS